jgi:hypothetical protein
MEPTNNTNILELALRKLPARGSSEPFAEEALWILREHEIVVYDDQVSLDRKIAIGAELARIKAGIKKARESWIEWTDRNLRGISHRSINRYMAIYRKHKEPRALEDPAAFLAQIYGNTTEEKENDAPSAPPPNSTLTSNLSVDGKKSPPKRTRPTAEAKTAPTTSTSTSTAPEPTETPIEDLSFDLAAENAIEEIEATVCDWKERFGNRLLEHPAVDSRTAGAIEGLLVDFELAVEVLTSGLRDAASEIA